MAEYWDGRSILMAQWGWRMLSRVIWASGLINDVYGTGV